MSGLSMKRLRTVEKLVNGRWVATAVQFIQKGDRIRLTPDTPDSREIWVNDNPLIMRNGDYHLPMEIHINDPELERLLEG